MKSIFFACVVSFLGISAHAATFNFAFTDESDPSSVLTAGGTIVLPDGDGVLEATDVTVTDAPTNAFFSTPFSFDLTLPGTFNSFTVSSGEIVASTLFVTNPNAFIGIAFNSAITGDEFSLQIPDAIGSSDLIFLLNGTTNGSPFEAAAVSTVPLPAAGWMLLASIGGIAAMKRRKRG